MKIFDKIKVKNDCKYYNSNGIYKGRIGRINSAQIVDNTFEVVFIDERFFDKNFKWTDENMETMEDDIFLYVNIDDIEVIEESNMTDNDILEFTQKKSLWCKVEDGYIVNLLGEKKNKIPYDYKS